ncbi:MAG: hypothetical protein ACYCW6_23865 [Candidatus Xenobia bacterium]
MGLGPVWKKGRFYRSSEMVDELQREASQSNLLGVLVPGLALVGAVLLIFWWGTRF